MTVSFRLHVFVCSVVTSFISDHLLPKGWSASTLSVTSFLQWIQCRSRTLDSFLPVASVTSALCLTNITDIFLHDSGPGFLLNVRCRRFLQRTMQSRLLLLYRTQPRQRFFCKYFWPRRWSNDVDRNIYCNEEVRKSLDRNNARHHINLSCQCLRTLWKAERTGFRKNLLCLVTTRKILCDLELVLKLIYVFIFLWSLLPSTKEIYSMIKTTCSCDQACQNPLFCDHNKRKLRGE